jgi:Tfp pilus assembly protein PilF
MSTSEIFKAAVLSFRAKNYQAALGQCRNVIAADPKQADAMHIIALCHMHLEAYEEAEEAYRKAREVHPLAHEVLNNHANMLRKLGRAEEAKSLLEEAISLKADFYQAWFSLGLAYVQLGETKEAEKAYLKVLSLHPQHVISLVNLGVLYNDQEEYQKALSVLDRALALQPQNALALNNRAAAFKGTGDLEKALADQRSAAAQEPNNPDILKNLARQLQKTGDVEEALHVYERALSIAPEKVEIHSDYNKLLWETGRRQEFLASLSHALTKVEDRWKGELLELQGRLSQIAGNHAMAIEAYSHARNFGLPDARAFVGLAKASAAIGEGEQAAEYFREAVKTAPQDTDIAHYFAEHLLEQGSVDEAERLLDISVDEAHLQKHIALQTTIYRLKGDERYYDWCDYDLLTAREPIEVPGDYGSLEVFLAAVEEELEPLLAHTHAPLDQTLFNGSQSVGRLWESKAPALMALKSALFKASLRHLGRLQHREGHPFLSRLPTQGVNDKIAFNGSWAVRLKSGGGHVDHIHPAGWMSSAHYVKVPSSVRDLGDDAAAKPGWLRLGVPGLDGVDLPAERYIKPEEGVLVLFPSYVWHGVEPFEAETPRITTPFDLALKHV